MDPMGDQPSILGCPHGRNPPYFLKLLKNPMVFFGPKNPTHLVMDLPGGARAAGLGSFVAKRVLRTGPTCDSEGLTGMMRDERLDEPWDDEQ
jgi:hypothetical protein